MRRRGIGTYLVQTGAALLEPRGVKVIRATTLPDNDSFIGMARALGGEVVHRPDLVEVELRRRRARAGLPARRAAEVLHPARDSRARRLIGAGASRISGA